MASLSSRLRELRAESGLSQRDLAKLLGLSKSSVNMYERGEREPGLATLEAIADYFNVDMDYLLGFSDVRNKWRESLSASELEDIQSKDKIIDSLVFYAKNMTPQQKQILLDLAKSIVENQGR